MTAATKSSFNFAALPDRAISDERLKLTHLRALGAVALHDRMSASRGMGAGCWASVETLAKRVNVNYSNFSTALGELMAWGYITKERHSVNKRHHVYRVVYEPLPTGKESGVTDDTNDLPIGKTSPTAMNNNTLPVGKTSGAMVCPTLCPPNPIGQGNQSDDNDKYITKDTPLKRERYSPKGAPIVGAEGLRNGEAAKHGAFLAIVERELRAGTSRLDEDTERKIESIAEETGYDEPIYQQAQRILETWGGQP